MKKKGRKKKNEFWCHTCGKNFWKYEKNIALAGSIKCPGCGASLIDTQCLLNSNNIVLFYSTSISTSINFFYE